jgi:hypothetical protein
MGATDVPAQYGYPKERAGCVVWLVMVTRGHTLPCPDSGT